MKIRLEIDPTAEEEVIIRCRELNENVTNIQKAINDIANKKQRFEFYKDDKEFFFSLDDILFFDTEDNGISAHTKNDVYKVKYKLYELETILPRTFIRVSKSTILNISQIYSLDWSITSSSVVTFRNTHKQVYVSRRYNKSLKNCLEDRY